MFYGKTSLLNRLLPPMERFLPSLPLRYKNGLGRVSPTLFRPCSIALALFSLRLLQTTLVASPVLSQVKTVFVIAMENHNFTQPSPTTSPQQISNNAAAPFINSLITPGNSNASQVSYCARYYNAGVGVHPSEPNYVWAEAGTDFGIHTDNDPSSGSANIFNAPHLTRQLNTAGISWKNYQEDVQLSSGPTHSASGTSATVINPYYANGQYNYAVKHNPMAFFSDTQTQNVYPLTQFATDLSQHTFGRYNWITPNQYNDQHSALSGGFTYHGMAYTGDQAAIAQGDNFLAILVPKIMATPEYQDHGIIIIRWDESEGGDTTSYTVPEILISPLARGNAYASSLEMSHSSDIKTVEQSFGLNYLSNAIPVGETRAAGSGYNNVATVNDLTDLFQPVPGLVVQRPPGVSLTNGLAAVAFGNVVIGASVTNLFTVTNTGNAVLNITNVGLSGVNAGDFAVTGISLPASVAVGAATTFQVIFAPNACGPSAATLRITNNDAGANPFTFSLSGTGDGMPVITWSFNTLRLNAGADCGAAMIDVTGTNYVLTSDICSGRALTITQIPTNGTLLTAGSSNSVVLTVADGFGNAVYSTNFVIVVDATSPGISAQPQSQKKMTGTTAGFSVTASACTAITYQWYFGTTVLVDATNDSLTLPSAKPADAGDYHVVLTSAGGSTISDHASLQVLPAAPNLISGRIIYGGSFELTFSGPTSQTYQVRATEDLTSSLSNWDLLTVGAFGETNAVFTDDDSTNHQARFYSIQSP